MSAHKSAAAANAAQRVIAGERKAAVSLATGVSRATIDRHLIALGHPPKPKRVKAAPQDTTI